MMTLAQHDHIRYPSADSPNLAAFCSPEHNIIKV